MKSPKVRGKCEMTSANLQGNHLRLLEGLLLIQEDAVHQSLRGVVEVVLDHPSVVSDHGLHQFIVDHDHVNHRVGRDGTVVRPLFFIEVDHLRHRLLA